MQAALLCVADLPDDVLASWATLHERALEQNPFFEPACVVPAARHLPEGDRIELLVALDEERTVVGAMPLRALPRWHWSRRRTATTKVRRLTWLGTPLLDRTRADEAMRVMLAHLRQARAGAGSKLLAVEWMHTGGLVADVLRRVTEDLGLPLGLAEQFERPGYLSPSASGRGALPEPIHRARSVQKNRRRLTAEVGPVTLVERSEEGSAVEELIAMEAEGYKSGAGIALRSWPGEPEWFTDMCDRFRAEGRLLTLSIVAGDRFVAHKVAVRSGDEVFLCITTYDESFARFSPGIQLHYDTIDHLAGSGIRRIDTCTYAGNRTEADIYPDRIPIATVLVGLGSPVERAALAALPLARRIRARGRAQVRPETP